MALNSKTRVWSPNLRPLTALYAISAVTMLLAFGEPAGAQINSFEERVELEFGEVIVGASGGTITLSPGNVVSPSLGLFHRGGSIPGSFRILGREGTTVTVSLPAGATMISGNDRIAITGFSTDLLPDTTLRGSDGPGGEALLDFNIGATVAIDPNQPRGDYIANFTVTLVFQ